MQRGFDAERLVGRSSKSEAANAGAAKSYTTKRS
jgi:hypothetical protein